MSEVKINFECLMNTESLVSPAKSANLNNSYNFIEYRYTSYILKPNCALGIIPT